LISRETRFTQRCASITEFRASGIQQRFSVRLISRIARSTMKDHSQQQQQQQQQQRTTTTR
jgi:hypothetical protein